MVLILLLVILRPDVTPWQEMRAIYPVQLVSMVQLPEKPVTVTEKMEPEPVIEPPKQEAPEKKINISKEAAPELPEESEKTLIEPVQPASEPAVADSGSVKIDIEDFPFAYYLTILRNRIQNNWHPPYRVATSDEKIATIVKFRVLRNGQIVDVSIEKTSERYLHDQAAQRAVYSANPLPPLPEEFYGEFLSVHIEFE